MCSSYPLMVQCRFFLEKCLYSRPPCFQDYQEIHPKFVRNLIDLYDRLEEKDLLFCFLQNWASYHYCSVKALSYYESNDMYKAYDYFKISRQSLHSKCLRGTSKHEIDFCSIRMTRCAFQLSSWDGISDMSSVSNSNIIVPECGILLELPSEESIMKSEFCHMKNEDIDIIKEKCNAAVQRVVKKWNFLSQNTPHQCHYTLLQLMQLLTEFSEAIDLVKYENIYRERELVQYFSSIWLSRSYLFSDDIFFTNALLNVRQRSLKTIVSKSVNSLHHVIASLASHASNSFGIELSSQSIKYQNVLMETSWCNYISEDNLLKFLEMKLFYYLAKAKKLVTAESKEELFSRTERLINMNRDILRRINVEEEKKFLFLADGIYAVLGRKPFTELLSNNPKSGKSYLIPGEYLEKILYCKKKRRQSNASESKASKNTAIQLLNCWMKACQFGTVFESLSVIPKILNLLEFDKSTSIIQRFRKYQDDIPDKYWIFHLPLIISCLCRSTIEEKQAFSSILRLLLQKLSRKYPQQVFFSIQSLEGMNPPVLFKGIYQKILCEMRRKHPVLVLKLEAFIDCFTLEYNTNASCDFYLEMFKQALDKANFLTFQDFKNRCDIYDSKKIVDYIREDLMPKILLIDGNTEQDDKTDGVIEMFNYHFSYISTLSRSDLVIQLLKDVIQALSQISKKSRNLPWSLELNKMNHVFSSHLFDKEDISIFEQCHLEDQTSVVKIHSLHPKLECKRWGDAPHLVYQIKVRGHDGKIYPYNIMLDFLSRGESLNTLTLMQLLENLNPLLTSNVHCAKYFLKFHFRRFVCIGSCLKMIPHTRGQVSLKSIYDLNAKDFSLVDVLFRLYNKDPYFEDDYEFIDFTIERIDAKVSEDNVRKFFDERFQNSLIEYTAFTKEITRSIAMLCAIEYLSICPETDASLTLNSGTIIANQLKIHFEGIPTGPCLLNRSMRKLLAPLSLKVVSRYTFLVLNCLKEYEENFSFLHPSFHLLRKNSSQKNYEQMLQLLNSVVKKLKSLNEGKVLCFIEDKFNCMSYRGN